MAFASLGTLGNYRLVQLLAQGGMGEVYLACQEGPEGFLKEVVIKCMLKHLAEDQGFVDLFLNEARLAVLLQHPNIVQTLELNRAEDSWFIVMEHVRGCSLKSCIRRAKKNRRRIPEAIAVWLIAEALQGLHFAHNLSDGKGRPLGILHRDVSPDNLLLSWEGAVKLVDFGISKARFRHVSLPTGGPKGKFPYMAPEYFVGKHALDVRSDVYSMGVTLHELLTLELPDCVPKDRESVATPRMVYEPRAELSKELNDILFRALNPNPGERWSSAAQMAEVLIQSLIAKGQNVHASTVSAWMRDFWDLKPDETFFELETPSEISLADTEDGGRFVGTEVLQAPGEVAKQALALSIRPRRTPRQNFMRGLATTSFFISIGLLYWVVISSPRELPLQPPTAMAVLSPFPANSPGTQESPIPEVVFEKKSSHKPPASERPGFVRIKAAPDTIVSYRGKRLGKTPMGLLKLPAGRVRLHVRNKQLGISKSYRVHIKPGEEVVLQVQRPKTKANTL
ncbi:MAG: serine/threonine protein kinase [Proteobacteria bacterium]|nr:serine/threonine protein kinase [Cystobacterineae bacterium]MCL2258875.1 serine/threonine protein kinase [Cystobacterineae bacterium]MCL2313734.1 serine/threonine protein kinase [Pseudomonadota bacterium]